MIKFFVNKKGYTLVEALVYIGVFILISSVIVSLILSVLETNQQASPMNSLSRGAVSVLEPITKEIRGARSVDFVNSSFGTSTGNLQLNTLDISGNLRTVRFYLNSKTVKIDDNGTYLGPLNSSDVSVTALIFNFATSSEQTIIKVELDLTAGSGAFQKSEKFYTAVGLRVDN